MVLPAGAQAANGSIGASIDQCANGQSGIADCTGAAWITGNLNENKSLYKGGDFVPFRAQITNLTNGSTYTLRIGYDAVEGDLHAYDYLGSYDATENAAGQRVDPCDGSQQSTGPHACGSAPSTVPVPADGDTTIPYRSQLPGSFSAWGGSLTGAAYVSPGQIGMSTTGTIERQIDVTFVAEGDTVVLAWGGHIASSLDWGAGETFVGNGQGSPFHMRLHQIQESGGGTTSTGQRDLSLQAGAIRPIPSPFDTAVSPQSAVVGATVIDTATLGGQGAPAGGTVDFYVCFDANSIPDCSTGGAAAGIGTVVAFPTSTGSASSEFVPRDPGHYCFRAEYRPSDVAPYSPGSHTNKDTECFEAKLARPTLTLNKLCVPPGDPGKFDLVIDGATTNVGCGGTIGPIEVNAGPHKIRESAGSGLGDYTSVIGGDCAADGSITLAAADNKTCTITNGRTAKPGTLKVNKVSSRRRRGRSTCRRRHARPGRRARRNHRAGGLGRRGHTVREASGTGTTSTTT